MGSLSPFSGRGKSAGDDEGADGGLVSGIDETPLTVTIPWDSLVGGMPEATTNAAEIREFGLALDWQYAYTEADAYPVDSNRTRVQMFVPSIGHSVLIRAVRGWATGEELGCPDLTQS